MRKFLTALLFGALLAASAWAKDVTVTSFSPQGELNASQTRPQFTVVFSGPVVGSAQLNKPVKGDASPLKFRPAVSGTAKWVAPNKLYFTPSASLAAATRYVADFGPGGLRTADGSLVAGPQSFEFKTPALKFESASIRGMSQSREVTLQLNFNAEVSPARLRGFLSVYNQFGSTVNYNIQGAAPAKQILVQTQPMWNSKTVKVVVSDGLMPNKGDIPQNGGLEVTLKLITETLVTGSNAYMSDSGRGRIHIELNNQVDLAKAKGYIELSPAVPFSLESSYDGFTVVGDFKPRDRVSVTIRKGLTGSDAEPMKEDFVKSFIFPDMSSSVRFPASGMFLTPAEAPRIAIETANVQTLELSAWKLYNNNVAVAALDPDDLDDDGFRRWAKPLGSKKFRVGGMVNEITRRAVDLTAIGCEGEGVYMIQAKNADPDTWDSARMLLAITDTALSARLYKRGLQVWASSIAGTKPLEGAAVKVYSASNQLLLTGTTDADGAASFTVDEGWDENLQPVLVTAEKDGLITFVKLGTNQLSGRDVDISGAPWKDAYDGMWTLPRALWQPGETLEAQAIVRSTALELPGEFPLAWKLTGRGIELAGGTVKLDANGAGMISAPIPATVESGTYSLRLLVPGTSTVVAERSVQIEEFRPPQIETSLKAPAEMFPGQEGAFDISARYLFGGSGAGLKWELSYTTVPEAYVSKTFPGYVFGSEMAKDAGRSSGEIESGELNEEGKASVSWTPDEDLRAPSIIRGHFRLSVMEANGRWTGSTASIPIYPTKALIGVMRPKGNIRPNADSEIGLVAVDHKDKPISLGSVDVEVSRVTSRYVMVTDDSGSRMTWQEEIGEPEKFTASITNGRGKFTFRPKDEGQYRITFNHADGRASLRVWVWENWQGSSAMGAAMPDRVEMKADRSAYAAGSTAKITIKSPFAGRALLTVGSDRPVMVKSFEMTGTETTVDVPVTDALLPNGWITVQVVRPEGADTKPPYRALGALPLKLDLSSRKLDVKVESPEKAEPGTFSARVVVKDAQGKPASGVVSIALVDRGILLLSGSDNADPWTFFTRLRGMDGKMCDIYDSLLPIEARGTALLHPAGGDDAEMARAKLMANADMMSPVRASDYVPLAIWLPSVELKDGAAEITTTIPEFAGALRVEAIALDGTSMGRATAESKIARPVVIDLSLPRFAAPGDTLRAALNLTAEEGGNAAVAVSASESLQQRGGDWTDKAQLAANRRFSATEMLPELTVGSDGSHGALKATVSLNGREYSSETGLAVRPGWPLTSMVGGGSAGEGTTDFELPDSWYPGTGALSVTISGAPVVDALSLLETVDTWGFGLDRAVSHGWITLCLPSLLSDEDKDLTNPIENRIALNTVLAQMASYQLFDGSWSAWRGDGTDPWGSVAALHFLTAVKESGILEPNGLEIGYQWLRRYMAEPLPEDSANLSEAMNARAYGCYVLALAGDAPLGWMNWLEERSGDLNGSGRALLAASYALAGEQEKAQKMVGAESNAATASLVLPEAGFRMLALDAIEPGGAPARDLAARIAADLAKGSGRRSARDAGSMIMALGVFSQHVVPGPVQAKLLGPDGTELASFDGKPAVWKGDKGGKFRITATGAGSLWYSWTASGVPATEPKSYSRGLRVERTILDAKTEEPVDLASVAFGQEVLMKVKITGLNRPADLRVSVLLPAGFEAANAGESVSSDGFSARSDLRFDRLLLNVSGRGKVFEWKLPCRATTRGTFTLPPVAVEALGNKGIAYLGKSASVTVQ